MYGECLDAIDGGGGDGEVDEGCLQERTGKPKPPPGGGWDLGWGLQKGGQKPGRDSAVR